MSSLNSWIRAFHAVYQAASASRGSIELNFGADDAARWPRTIGADVIAIAAVFDPALRTAPVGFGGHALEHRWSAAMDDIERFALREPLEPYRENRSFWNTLSAVCVYLNAEGAPLPGRAIWSALLAQLADQLEPRNAGPSGDGPFKQFDGIKTFDDLFVAQLKHLRESRGSDDRDPEPGMTGGQKPIPRSTNGDVVLLADYWTKQLARVRRVMGADGVDQRWKAALVDVDGIARKGDPNAVYPKNNAFWRILQQTAIHVAVADEAPSQTDLMLDALKDSLISLPANIKAGAQAIASGAADIAGSVAHGVGRVAHDAGSGLFGGFGAPLLIGAGLVGLFLITRGDRHESAES